MDMNQPGFSFTHRVFSLVIFAFLLFSSVFQPIHVVMSINSIHTPFLDLFFAFLTNLGNGLIVIPCIIILSFHKIYWSIGLVTSAAVEGIIVFLCKHFLFQFAKRPINFLDSSAVHFVPGIEVHKGMSFPSGHTVTIFGLCIFLALCYRNNLITMLLITIASLVAISRVYLLQHFFTDITGGAVVGSIIGIVVFHWMERINKPQWMIQRLEIKMKSTVTTSPRRSRPC